MATAQKDVFSLKGDVACIYYDVAVLQSSANRIEESLSSLRSILQPFPVVNLPVQEIKSDNEIILPTPPKGGRRLSRSSPGKSVDASVNTEELNTSEVTFKPQKGATYAYGTALFEDHPHEENTESQESQWPSYKETGMAKYAEGGPSSSHPGYMTVVGKTSPDGQFKTVGYIRKLPEGTVLPEDVDDSFPDSG